MREFACLRLAAAGILAAFLSLGAGGAAKALYDVEPSEIPGKPGSIIRIWPLEGGGPGMGGNGEAFRILYRSTDPSGRPIPVSGAIYIPNGPAPAGGRNIIAWAHPTSGVVPPCAPSLMPDVGGMMWNLPNMISQGYIVVATDYPGLGTDGIHPYLIGESEARSVLDSVRAARALPNTGASNRFAVWGHSQGGHAALYTGEVAARYFADPTELNFAEFMRVCVPLYARTPLPPDAVARIEMNLALTAHWDATSARDFDVRADAERVQCPVLVLAGEDDPSTTIAGIEELVEALPAELVRYERYAETGHGVFRDRPEAIGVVREFLAAAEPA